MISLVTRTSPLWLLSTLLLVLLASRVVQSRQYRTLQVASFGGKQLSLFADSATPKSTALPRWLSLQGGASHEERNKEVVNEEDETEGDEEETDETDDEESEELEDAGEEERENDEYDVEDDYDEEDDYDDEVQAGSSEVSKGEFVEPFFMSPSIQLYTAFGCMMISRKIDMFNPTVVRILRFAFIAQIIIQQLFVIYVRITAKRINDRSPITVNNPLSGMLKTQLDQQDAANEMVKSLASSFLSSETTVMEYDMKQASSMQGGVLFNLAFMWLLHFKFQKTQPLLLQAVQGLIQLACSPLFQVYVLGRNLERPFKRQVSAAQKLMEAKQAQQQTSGSNESSDNADVEDDAESSEDADEDTETEEATDDTDEGPESGDDEEDGSSDE